MTDGHDDTLAVSENISLTRARKVRLIILLRAHARTASDTLRNKGRY